MTELQQYIQSYFGVDTTQLETIEYLFKPQSLRKGEYFCKPGRLCDGLGFVQEGLLRVYAIVGDKEVTQWIATKGYFITDLASLVFKAPARWYIQALTDVELFTIDRSDYHNIGLVLPRWHELEKLFIAKCSVLMESRIFNHLSLSAEQRYDQLFETNPSLLNQVPLQYLASMLGMTAETFSRIRKKKLS